MNLPGWILSSERILVAPLNWGLGHATRCIPIIDHLISQGKEVHIGSDGRALELLRSEFGKDNMIHQLPGYNMRYSHDSIELNIVRHSLGILKSIRKEHEKTRKLVYNHNFDTIISDNRYGVWNKTTQNVIICHQLNIQGNIISRNIGSLINAHWINRFDECWIPDNPPPDSLAGKLSIPSDIRRPHYIGTLSRLKPIGEKLQRQVMIILSGPEPKRSVLEDKLLNNLDNLSYLMVRGTPEASDSNLPNLVNYMTSKELNKEICKSEVIVCRAGYSSIMDMVELNKKAVLIPTPGQTEQEYLARYITEKGLAQFKILREDQIETIADIIRSMLDCT